MNDTLRVPEYAKKKYLNLAGLQYQYDLWAKEGKEPFFIAIYSATNNPTGYNTKCAHCKGMTLQQLYDYVNSVDMNAVYYEVRHNGGKFNFQTK